MRRIYFIIAILFFIINNVYAQNKYSFLVEKNIQKSGSLIVNTKNYVTIHIDPSAAHNTYFLTIDGIVYQEPNNNNIFFSSLSLDSNKISNNSTSDIERFYYLNRRFPLIINEAKIWSLDSVKTVEAIKTQLECWRIEDDVRLVIQQYIYINLKDIVTSLGIPLTSLKNDRRSESYKIGSASYEIEKLSKKKLKITYSDTSPHNSLNGLVVLDSKTGVLFSRKQSEDFLSYGISEDIEVTRLKDTKLSILDADYVDAFVTSNSFSKMLYAGSRLDTTKVVDFVEKNFKLITTNNILAEFSINQLTEIERKDYSDSLLRVVPLSILKGSYILINYLNNNFETLPIQKIDEVIENLDENTLYSSLQNVIFQYVNYDILGVIDRVNYLALNSNKLDNKLIMPLYYWSKARKYDINDTKRLEIELALLGLDDDYWVSGNAGRYVLLLYKDKILKNKTDKQAQLYLEMIIDKLKGIFERNNTERTDIIQIQLATANFWMSELAILENSKLSDYYVYEAYRYSLKPDQNPSRESNYESMFLKSKVRYHEEYNAMLIARGDKDLALNNRIFDFLKSQAKEYYNFKKFYLAYYPSSDFGSFFKEYVLPKLENAPLFTLNDIYNKEDSLLNYKGKWVLLDFWGTWCLPCVEEMPKLNAFHNSLIDSNDIRFLTIACSDSEGRVKDFLNKNNYTIPVLMSDGIIQHTYKVDGYPSKYLISPEGKMLRVPYGVDWLPILNELVSM